jgi:membrane-associated phospholipid phosphatase
VAATDHTAVRVGEAAAVVGGATALAGSWVVVAVAKHVPRWEARVFDWVNGLPDALWPILWGPMQLGSLLGSLLVVAATGAVTRDRRLTLAALVASQVAWWSAKAVKRMVARGRPASLISDVRLRENAGGLGYVSGHTAVAFALAAVLAPSMPPRWRRVAFAVAVVVGAARIYAGAHLPLDVVGGAGVGLLCGTLSRWAFGLGGEGLPVAR